MELLDLLQSCLRGIRNFVRNNLVPTPLRVQWLHFYRLTLNANHERVGDKGLYSNRKAIRIYLPEMS